jgi:hypothetical protein
MSDFKGLPGDKVESITTELDGIVLGTKGVITTVTPLTTGGTLITVNFIGNRKRLCYPQEIKVIK